MAAADQLQRATRRISALPVRYLGVIVDREEERYCHVRAGFQVGHRADRGGFKETLSARAERDAPSAFGTLLFREIIPEL